MQIITKSQILQFIGSTPMKLSQVKNRFFKIWIVHRHRCRIVSKSRCPHGNSTFVSKSNIRFDNNVVMDLIARAGTNEWDNKNINWISNHKNSSHPFGRVILWPKNYILTQFLSIMRNWYSWTCVASTTREGLSEGASPSKVWYLVSVGKLVFFSWRIWNSLGLLPVFRVKSMRKYSTFFRGVLPLQLALSLRYAFVNRHKQTIPKYVEKWCDNVKNILVTYSSVTPSSCRQQSFINV